MVKGEAMSYNEGVSYVNVPPAYSVQCECGVIIGGISEKGLHSLLKRHKEKGIFHDEWIDGSNGIFNPTS
jgi:hypothetical protein